MIFDIAIIAGSQFINLISLLLPTSSSLPSETDGVITTIASYMYMVDILIAVNHLLIAIGIVLSFELIKAGIQLTRWIIRSIPFLNMRI